MCIFNVVKQMLNITDDSKDDVIRALIESCKAEFKSYCKVNNITVAAKYVIVDMVICRFNKLGAEGLTSQSFSGISESYTEGYPAHIQKSMNAFRKVQFL